MKLKQDIYDYPKSFINNIIDIFVKHCYIDSNSTFETNIEKILNIDILLLNTNNIKDFIPLLNELDYIFGLSISDDICFKYFQNISDININKFRISEIFVDNNINNIIDNNIIKDITIKKSYVNIDSIDLKNVNKLLIYSSEINKLNKIISNKLYNLRIDNKYRSKPINVVLDNRHDTIYNILLDNVNIKFKHNISIVDSINFKYINKIDIDTNNINFIETMIINECSINNLIIDSNTNIDDIELIECNIDKISLNGNINNIFEFNSKVNYINEPFKTFNEAFLRYYTYIIEKIKNENISDKEKFEYIKFLKKYNKDFIEISENLYVDM